MTSSLQQQQHLAKFRWTEKLTCRFIQLRRDHAKMFTGRKYSAQQGWEYILRQMRHEFPAIMADVHYRVLKKKWSNLLQQYKELKNPVHGDKNRADDISWPFYAAIDEVIASLGSGRSSQLQANNSRRRRGASRINDNETQQQRRRDNDRRRIDREDDEDDEDEDEEDDLNPQEFLCVSVSTTPPPPPIDYVSGTTNSAMQQQQQTLDNDTRTRRSLLSRLPRATELTIRPAAAATTTAVKRNNREISRASAGDNSDDEGTARKSCRRQEVEEDEGLERRIVEFMEYTKKRDEENRSILMRMLEALEDIRNALG